jgi:hypothetical protein
MSSFEKKGKLIGSVKITDVPPFLGYSMSLSLFWVRGPDTPPPFDDVAPPEARQDEAQLEQNSTCRPLHDTMSVSGGKAPSPPFDRSQYALEQLRPALAARHLRMLGRELQRQR